MSDLRVALVAEGPTDSVVIEAGLRAVLDRPFTLTLIQPEATRPQMGTGWCGVFKWCREFDARKFESLEGDPTLEGFDLFIVHLDADVAEASYADGGTAVELAAAHLPRLPCPQPCPPPSAAADQIRKVILAWLGLSCAGQRTVLCVPSKAIEAWVAVAVLEPSHALLFGIECNLTVPVRLASLPKSSRICKTTREYRKHASTVTKNWSEISEKCTQAERFGREVAAAVASVSSQ